MVASIIFVLDKKTDLISAPHALVYFGIVIFFVYFKVNILIFKTWVGYRYLGNFSMTVKSTKTDAD